mgnify:CR=1 FL=1
MVLLGVAEHALYYLLVDVYLHDDAVGIAENFIALAHQHVGSPVQVGAGADGHAGQQLCAGRTGGAAGT